MSSTFAINSLTRQTTKAPTDTGAPRFITLAAGLLDGIPTNLTPADCGAWKEHAESLTLAASAGGRAAVASQLKVWQRDYPEVVKAIEAAPRPRKTHYTTAELLTMEFAPPVCVVPGLLHEGLNLFGGRPKLGKSWLALQIAQAVATGGKVFGQDVERGPVLYLALEDSEARLKSRMTAQGWTADAQVDFHVSWPLMANGGLDELNRAIEAVKYRLVIIDTASRFMGGKIDQMDPGVTNDAFGALQQMGLIYHSAVFMLDHHRKSNEAAPDPVDDILGSTGKAAPPDTVLGLYRQRGKSEATLMLASRELADTNDLALKWDTMLSCWQCVGKAGDVKRESTQGELMSALAELETATTARLAQFTRRHESHVSRDLGDLSARGYVVKTEAQGREKPYSLTVKGKQYIEDLG